MYGERVLHANEANDGLGGLGTSFDTRSPRKSDPWNEMGDGG